MNTQQQYPELSFKGFIQWLFHPIINWMMKGRREAEFQQRYAESIAMLGEENIIRYDPVTITDEDRARFDLQLAFGDRVVSAQTDNSSKSQVSVSLESAIEETITSITPRKRIASLERSSPSRADIAALIAALERSGLSRANIAALIVHLEHNSLSRADLEAITSHLTEHIKPVRRPYRGRLKRQSDPRFNEKGI